MRGAIVRGEDLERDVIYAFVVSRSDVEIIACLYWGGWFEFLRMLGGYCYTKDQTLSHELAQGSSMSLFIIELE